jgi:endonuclease/exonuclease/phosphatase family metal-dependent hydrolase
VTERPPERPNDHIRVLTYNLRDLKDDAGAVARVVRAINPDVACLQEVPRHPFSGHRIGALADACGLLWSGGGAHGGGTVVLTALRLDQLAAHSARLPVTGRTARSRGYAAAVVAPPGGPSVIVVSVHLGLDPDERLQHARLVLDRLEGGAARTEPAPTAYVVAGDLNEPPGGPAWLALGGSLTDAATLDGASSGDGFTYSAREPRRRIDAVMVSKGVAVQSIRVAGPADGVSPADLLAASDHLPVVADLRIPAAT